MVTSTEHRGIQLRDINGQVREVRQTRTARIYSQPSLIAELHWSLMDSAEHHRPDDLRDLDERIGR